jgi:hypothetical protein
MIDKAMNTLSRAVMYLIIDPNLSANRIVAEPPPLTSGTSESRNTIIGTVSGFLILVVGGLLFGIIIIRRRRNGNGKIINFRKILYNVSRGKRIMW